MGGLVAADFAMLRGFGGEFVKPCAADLGRFLRSTAMLGKFCPSGAVGIEQAFNQGWGQRGGGEQYAAAEQAGTMYKAAEGWQIVDAEVVGFIKNQVAAH